MNSPSAIFWLIFMPVWITAIAVYLGPMWVRHARSVVREFRDGVR